MARPPKQLVATSLPQLAAVLGIASSATVDSYLHRGMPGHGGVPGARGEPGKGGRYDVAAAVAWMRENIWQRPVPVGQDGMTDLERNQSTLAKERWLALRMKRRRERKQLVWRTDVDHALAKMTHPISEAVRLLERQFGREAGDIMREAIEDGVNSYYPGMIDAKQTTDEDDDPIPGSPHPVPGTAGEVSGDPYRDAAGTAVRLTVGEGESGTGAAEDVPRRDPPPAPPPRRRARKAKAKTPPKVNPKTKKVK